MLTTHQNQTGRSESANRRADRLLRAIASTKIAVALIGVLVFVLAWATVYEGTWGRAAVEYYVYHSWWFVAIFVLIFTNVAAALLVRFPWHRHQLDFVVTHVGLLTLLIAMTVSLIDAVQGKVVLQPGMQTDSIELVNRSQLSVARGDGDRSDRVTLPFPDIALELTPDAFDDGVIGQRIAVRIVEFHAAESGEVAVTAGRDRLATMPHATALVELRSGEHVQRAWLEQNGDATTVRIGDTQLILELASQRMTLGFFVQLLEFRRTTNPGGYGIASYTSKVRFADQRDSHSREVELAVNRPARHKGFRFIHVEARRTNDGQDVVTILATRDRGSIFKYLGVTLVCLGMVITVMKRVGPGVAAARNDVSKQGTPPMEAEG